MRCWPAERDRPLLPAGPVQWTSPPFPPREFDLDPRPRRSNHDRRSSDHAAHHPRAAPLRRGPAGDRQLLGPLLRGHPGQLHRRPAVLVRLVPRTPLGSVQRPPGSPGAVGTDAGGRRARGLDHQPAPVDGGGLLPLRRHRRRHRALPGRVRPATQDRHRLGHLGARSDGAVGLHRPGGRPPGRSTTPSPACSGCSACGSARPAASTSRTSRPSGDTAP